MEWQISVDHDQTATKGWSGGLHCMHKAILSEMLVYEILEHLPSQNKMHITMYVKHEDAQDNLNTPFSEKTDAPHSPPPHEN